MEVLKIGQKINGATVQGALFTGGERYYFLIDRFGTVSLMPETSLQLTPDQDPSH